MSGAVFDVSQRLATVGGFLLAIGSIIVDHEMCNGAESKTTKKTNEMVSNIESAIKFIQNERLTLERLKDENHRMEIEMVEKSKEIEVLRAALKQYHDSEQEIPGR